MSEKELVERFLSNAAAVAAEPVSVTSDDQMNEVVTRILAETEGLVYCPGVTQKEIAVSIPEDRRTADYLQAAICIDETLGAVAESGSIILGSNSGKPVQAGLVAMHHVALVPVGGLFETFEDFFATQGDTPPTNITLETGPSRTADIELTLTIGVHGPGRLSILLML